MTDTATSEAVRGTMHAAGEQARGVAETGMEEVVKVASEVKTQTSKLVGDAGSKVRERADAQLGAAASMLSGLSTELQQLASNTSPDSSLASLVRDGATMTRQLSQRLEQGGLDGAMRDARMFARRRPVMFLAGAFAVGIMAGRLMRNVDMRSISPSNSEDANGQTDARSGTGGAYGDDGWTSEPSSGTLSGAAGGTTGVKVTETSVPVSTEDSADIEADCDAPAGGPITGEPRA